MAGRDLIAHVPPALEASEPPEARGLRRDEVRLLVSDLEHDAIQHARFYELPYWLSAGDLLVVNASGTLNAALSVCREDGDRYELHLSTRLPGGFWTVELRRRGPLASLPFSDGSPGERLMLPGGARATLLAPYPFAGTIDAPSRLWMAALSLPEPLEPYLERFGFPIRYSYVSQPWPDEMYQTIFATTKGSAEMPSAGRPFTPRLVTRLISRGVEIAPLVLHTGVASLESHEPPYEEYFEVSRDTAERVNAARRAGRHVVAVGTTVVRALETVTDPTGTTHPGKGWTDLVITPDRPLRSVDSLVTGLHEPRATHLMLLEGVVAAAGGTDGTDTADLPAPDARVSETFCGVCHLRRAYDEAVRSGYLWHEFGDAHLILGRALRQGASSPLPVAQGF
jgi:S-adenosylmethionine:tRNA ribosyltransferase-isomerase